jgi:metallo-beta-lactamase class B
MRSLAVAAGLAVSAVSMTVAHAAQAPSTPVPATGAQMPAASAAAQTVDGLVSAAKVAAGTDWSGTFMRLCIPPPGGAAGGGARGGGRGAAQAGGAGRTGAPAAGAAAGAGAARGGGRAGGAPPRENWYAEPAKVADNLYFLGTKVHHAWAIVGSDGIIVLEALFDYATGDEVLDGLKKMGLDPARVKYVLISHGHGDHDGGAKLLQDEIPGVRLVYGAEDWDLVTQATNRAGGVPRRDMVGTDGMKVSVGDASVQIVTMPGHTAGTLSFLFEGRDNGKPLRVAYVGGTAIPFNGDAAYYDRYLASSAKMAKAAADFGATVLMSNHTEFDNGYYRAHTAANRRPGAPNPFEVGRDAVARYFTVVQTCTTATKLRATGE